jgi:hypothetical protein
MAKAASNIDALDLRGVRQIIAEFSPETSNLPSVGHAKVITVSDAKTQLQSLLFQAAFPATSLIKFANT